VTSCASEVPDSDDRRAHQLRWIATSDVEEQGAQRARQRSASVTGYVDWLAQGSASARTSSGDRGAQAVVSPSAVTQAGTRPTPEPEFRVQRLKSGQFPYSGGDQLILAALSKRQRQYRARARHETRGVRRAHSAAGELHLSWTKRRLVRLRGARTGDAPTSGPAANPIRQFQLLSHSMAACTTGIARQQQARRPAARQPNRRGSDRAVAQDAPWSSWYGQVGKVETGRIKRASRVRPPRGQKPLLAAFTATGNTHNRTRQAAAPQRNWSEIAASSCASDRGDHRPGLKPAKRVRDNASDRESFHVDNGTEVNSVAHRQLSRYILCKHQPPAPQ